MVESLLHSGRSHGRLLVGLVALAAIAVSGACSINPATGQRQFSLIGEQQEIAMGREYDKSIEAELGLYPDEELQGYVQELGGRLAAQSERPDLPWEFHVVDDSTVNAFALPGGYIYVTRGILAFFDSEAQLVSVLGHEIGHVTARHSVEQMSRAQLAQLGVGIAMVASEEFRKYSDLAQLGLGVLFLKFGRDDEKQSDDLGLRYLVRAGYDPTEMPSVFDMLDRQGSLHDQPRLPEWQSTHPNPDRRADRIQDAISMLPPDQRQGTVNREAYLERLDGLVFGTDPRQGYAVGSVFYHPDMEFHFTFPEGWKVVNQRAIVAGISPQEDGVVALTVAQGDNPLEAANAFFSQEGIQRGQRLRQDFFEFKVAPQTDPQTGQTRAGVKGSVGFVAHKDLVFRLICYTAPEKWGSYSRTMQQSLLSFKTLRIRRFLDVQPKKIDIVRLPRSMTLNEFNRQYPSTIDFEVLEVLNGVDSDTRLESGRLMKRVVGKDPPKK